MLISPSLHSLCFYNHNTNSLVWKQCCVGIFYLEFLHRVDKQPHCLLLCYHFSWHAQTLSIQSYLSLDKGQLLIVIGNGIALIKFREHNTLKCNMSKSTIGIYSMWMKCTEQNPGTGRQAAGYSIKAIPWIIPIGTFWGLCGSLLWWHRIHHHHEARHSLSLSLSLSGYRGGAPNSHRLSSGPKHKPQQHSSSAKEVKDVPDADIPAETNYVV